jgi:hypothetical protein
VRTRGFKKIRGPFKCSQLAIDKKKELKETRKKERDEAIIEYS